MAEMTVTCHTPECENAGVPILVVYDDAYGTPGVTCGPCGQPIDDVGTDVAPTTEEGT